METLYAGVDIHKDNYVGCIMNQNEEVVREFEFPPTVEGAQAFLSGMPVKSIAIEACGMWRGAMMLFRAVGYQIVLTSPKKTHDIASVKKTDKVDAKTLANLLRTNFLPKVYVPSDEILQLRDLTRHKEIIMHLRVNVQNKIKAYLLRDGTNYPPKLWSVAGMKWLKAIEDLNIQTFVRLYEEHKAEEKEILKRIGNITRNKRETTLLMTMPGIAEFSALMIYAEIADIKRFKSPKELVMYAGLCPGVYQTGNTERCVRNYEVNKHLKWIVTECSGRASIMSGTRFQKHYSKIAKRRNSKIARRSTARKMLTIIWHMLTNQETYNAPLCEKEVAKATLRI
jgi:transposase